MSLVIAGFDPLGSVAPQGVSEAIARIRTKVAVALANRRHRLGRAAIDDHLLRDMGLSRTELAFDIREPWRN